MGMILLVGMWLVVVNFYDVMVVGMIVGSFFFGVFLSVVIIC